MRWPWSKEWEEAAERQAKEARDRAEKANVEAWKEARARSAGCPKCGGRGWVWEEAKAGPGVEPGTAGRVAVACSCGAKNAAVGGAAWAPAKPVTLMPGDTLRVAWEGPAQVSDPAERAELVRETHRWEGFNPSRGLADQVRWLTEELYRGVTDYKRHDQGILEVAGRVERLEKMVTQPGGPPVVEQLQKLRDLVDAWSSSEEGKRRELQERVDLVAQDVQKILSSWGEVVGRLAVMEEGLRKLQVDRDRAKLLEAVLARMDVAERSLEKRLNLGLYGPVKKKRPAKKPARKKGVRR